MSKKSEEKEEPSQKAKANKELLEKLKEEMRKIRKPSTQTTESAENMTGKQSTLLTIPPLLVGNSDFVLSSCSYLKTSEKDSKAESSENDGKILCSEIEKVKSDENSNKRKYLLNQDNSDLEGSTEEDNEDEESESSQDSRARKSRNDSMNSDSD